MPAFRRVEPQHAGPQALGILVPPGARTVVVLRPRSLDWDLLPATWSGDPARAPAFRDFGRDEAAQLARRLQQALEDAAARGVNPVETLGDAQERAFQVWVRAADFFWIPCRKTPAQHYQPLLFADRAAAQQAGEVLARIVWPAADAGQEYYFNTQQFVATS
ncbi:MAG: hypothetical protein L0Y71_26220 [Gemmataceae bacterium]|nr:hypothetical protein [Gemmataceae bacterium]